MTKPVAVLIGCTVSKRNKPCKAGEMYIPSQLFRKSISVAEQVKAIIGDGDLLVLASEIYLTFTRHIDNKIINPLNKLRIGKRSQWLSKSIAE